ncbi:MAG: hypothetical protein Q4D98_12710 [Planctomycetia bacterium]|nr:hypothetical protein [Planctomycetia bacterium]
MFSKIRLGLVLLACGGVSVLLAADKELQEARAANRAAVKAMAQGAKTVKLDAQAADGAVEVDLFKAIEDDQIAAGVMQNDMKGGKLFIQNKTDKPLSVKVPAAFGTRPILAQMDGGGGGNQQQMFGGNGMGGGGMGAPPPRPAPARAPAS